MLYYELGWIGLAVPGLLTLLTALQFLANKITYSLNKKRFEVADKRAGKVNEMINGIKTIKFNVYEKLFFSQIMTLP